MPVIVIKNLAKKSVPVQDLSQPILRHLQDYGIDWMHACGGKGRCTTCMFRIIQGEANLQPKTDAEVKYERLGALQAHERLACQARMVGDVVIVVPAECKLPHLLYSDD